MKSPRMFFRKLTGFFRGRNVELPHRGTLILAALCISVIAVALSYRIKEARMEAGSNLIAVAGVDNQVLAADERVAAALTENQNVLLGALATSTNPFEPAPEDSMSERFTKGILSAYAAYEYSADGGKEPEIASDDVINSIDTSSLPQPKYTIKNLTVFVPKSNEEIKAYGDLFAKTYLTTIAPVLQNQAMYSTQIGAVGELYRKISANLLRVAVPTELATLQLQVINDFTQMADTFPFVDGQEKDPVRALLGLRIIQNNLTELPMLFIKMNRYFKQNGILFDKTEAGYIWTQVPDSLPETATDVSAWAISPQ